MSMFFLSGLQPFGIQLCTWFAISWLLLRYLADRLGIARDLEILATIGAKSRTTRALNNSWTFYVENLRAR